MNPPNVTLSREALEHDRRAPSRLERMLAHSLLVFLVRASPTPGRSGHRPTHAAAGSPDRSTAPRRCQPRRCRDRITKHVPAPAALTPPNSTAPRITTDRSLARCRVEKPDPMPFGSFVFVFVVFEFLLTYR